MKLLYTCKNVKLSSYNLLATINGTRIGPSIIDRMNEHISYFLLYHVSQKKKHSSQTFLSWKDSSNDALFNETGSMNLQGKETTFHKTDAWAEPRVSLLHRH